jgi:hypothetical protein
MAILFAKASRAREISRARLIIPTSLRNDYLTVLEALTANANAEPFMAFAHKLIEVNSRMPFGSFEQSLAYFRQNGALEEPLPGFGFTPSMLEAKP